MTIKLRITLGFLCSIAIVAACVIGYTGWQMRDDARGYFITASGQQLRLMDENLTSFVSAASHSAQIVAELPGLAEAKDIFPRFVDNPQESRYRQSDLSPEAQDLTETLLRVGRANPDYLEVYVGYADGSYASSHSGSVLPTSPFMALGKKQSSHKAANVAGGCSDPVGVASTRTEAVREPVPLPASPPARTQGDEIAGAGTQRSWSIPWDHFPSPRQSPVKH